MARNKVMTLWTALVTAIIAMLAALGFASPAAAAPVPRSEAPRNSAPAVREARVPAAAPARYARSLPPTMKQRIGAEAHGSTPSCRACATPQDFDAVLADTVNAALAAQERPDSPPARPHSPAEAPATAPGSAPESEQSPVVAPSNVRGNGHGDPAPLPAPRPPHHDGHLDHLPAHSELSAVAPFASLAPLSVADAALAIPAGYVPASR
ncbi:DUF6344 domain-containing protein [Streptomyces sp. JNUCC 64]